MNSFILFILYSQYHIFLAYLHLLANTGFFLLYDFLYHHQKILLYNFYLLIQYQNLLKYKFLKFYQTIFPTYYTLFHKNLHHERNIVLFFLFNFVSLFVLLNIYYLLCSVLSNFSLNHLLSF